MLQELFQRYWIGYLLGLKESTECASGPSWPSFWAEFSPRPLQFWLSKLQFRLGNQLRTGLRQLFATQGALGHPAPPGLLDSRGARFGQVQL